MPLGRRRRPASCLSGETLMYKACKECPNACAEYPYCPEGTICQKDECSGTYCPIGCETKYTQYCSQPNTNCTLLGYDSISPDCVGQTILHCPYNMDMVKCVPVDEGDCCRNCKKNHPYTSIPTGYIQTDTCECCGKTYYQAEINPCNGFVTEKDCPQGVDETSETCQSGDVIKYAACKGCGTGCMLKTCPEGTICSFDDCSQLYCATGCATDYTNYCSSPNMDCAALGYRSLAPDCLELDILHCPFDVRMVWCVSQN